MALNDPLRAGCYALFLFTVLHIVLAGEQCKTGCNGGSGLLKLAPGTTYKYNYDGKINILLSSAEGQQTTTEVKATVLLTQQANCNQLLRLQNVQIIGPDGKKRMGIPGLEKAVVLNNNNGNLDDFICTEPGDNQNSINLKRAIASFFQVDPQKNTEIDVFGQCPTQISKIQDGDAITITKNKILNKCSHRESISHNILTSTFNIQSEIQSSPILSSNLDSKQIIKAGILETASVVENYLLVPFSSGHNGAKASIESTLSIAGTSNENPTSKCQIPKSIMFENPHPVNVPRSNAAIILNKVKDISAKLVDPLTSVHYVDLVKLLRVSKKVDILTVYNQVRSGAGIPDKDGAKKILLDAILIAGNGDTIEVAIELLKSKELNKFEEKQLYLGLSHARHVTENSIKTATDLLNRANIPKEAYLGVGSLAGRYCAHHKCENNDVINKIISKFLSKLGDLKAADRREEKDMIFVLKGLSNIHYLSDAALSKIISIAEDQNEPSRLRVAALNTYNTKPCEDKLRNSALKILENIDEDSEIRINAYLVLTQCPNDVIGNAIKALLEKEQSQQVGGYISSNIKNIRASANPDKILAKTHLGFIHTPSRFLFDPRKYSFNGEFSYAIDAIGLSNNIEGNVIYSQKSWLPRSANLNLTAELFGKRFNFLEVAARQENLDRVLEHYIGPQGILRKATLQENWDNVASPVKELIKNFKENVEKSLRARRDVSRADIDALAGKIQETSNELDKNFDLDLSVKTFGSEILFMNSFDDNCKLTPQQIIEKLISHLNGGLDKLKNFEETVRANIFFLDAELSYPTSLGFPLRLGIDGAANIQVKTEGNIDVRKLISRSATDDISLKLSIIPSATITLNGKFSLDTPLLENGLKISSAIHTSTGVDFTTSTFKNGLGLDVQLNLPVQKQNLIDLKHNIIFQTKENGAVLKNQQLKFSQNKDFSICIDHLANYIGLEFCLDMNGPNLSGKKIPVLPFPLSGDAKASIRIERNNIDTLHYRREFSTSKEGAVGVKATLEALGKDNAKGVSLNVEGFLTPEKYLKVSLNSPIKNAEAEARLIFNEAEKVLSVSLKDENKLYTAKAGLKLDGTKDKIIYKPILEYTTPQKQTPQTPPFHVEGQIISETNGNNVKYTFDNVKLVIPGQKTIVLTGMIGNDGPKYLSDLTLSDGHHSGSFKGSLQLDPNILKIHTHLKNSMRPALDFDFKGEFKKHKGTFLSHIQLSHGKESDHKKNSLTLINVFNTKDSKDLEFSTKNKIVYPLAKLDGKFDLEKTAKSLDYDTHLHFGEMKVGSELKLKVHLRAAGDYKLEFELYGGKSKLELKSTRQVLGSTESKIENSLAVNGKKIEVAGKIKHHVKPHDINVGADLIAKLPNNKTPVKLLNGLKANPKEIDFHLKILSGSNPLIDTSFKTNRNTNANGHIKVDFKDLLHIHGNLKAQNGAGKGDILIEAKTVKKSVKAETAFTIKKPTYNLEITIYPDFSNEKHKKISISTKTKWSGLSLDSSNTLDFLGHDFILNAKGQLNHPLNGKSTLDVDLTLPNKHYLMGKLFRDVTSKDGTWNSNNLIHLEHRNKKDAPGQKLILKALAKDTNPAKGILDLSGSIVADDSSGHNVKLDAALKRTIINDKKNLQFDGTISSSLLKTPIKVNLNSEGVSLSRTFNLKVIASPQASIQAQGKYSLGSKQLPVNTDITVEVQIPFEILSNLKVSHSVTKIDNQDQGLSLELSGALQTVSSIPKLNIDAKNNLKISLSKKEGYIQIHGETNKPDKSAVDLSGNYNVNLEKSTGTFDGNFKVILPGNKLVQGSGTLSRLRPHEYKIDASLDLPTQAFKSNKLTVLTKRTDKQISNQLDLISDGKKYALTSDLSYSIKEPSVDIKLVYPDGKITEFAAGIKRPSNARIMANLKVMCQCRDFLLEGGLDVNSESLNDFYIQLTANCPKFNVNGVLVKVGHSGVNTGNTVDILVQSGGKDIVSGSSTVSSREEQGKYIVEGSGNFKVNGEDKSGNFKYIRTSLTSDKNGEIGDEISFDATLGNKAIDAELKLTNKEFRYLNSYCEESKQCAHVEINAKTSVNEMARYNNLIEITIDLRVLGVPNEFGLKAVTHRENWMLDHTVDVHFENAANKYQYSVYVHPNASGISLTTPQRIIALEANANIPKSNIQNGGQGSAEISFYTDKKNNPNTKTSLSGTIDVNIEKQTINADLTLNVAGQTKPICIKFTQALTHKEMTFSANRELVLDIFAQPDQKLVISRTDSVQLNKDSYEAHKESSTKIKSSGLGVDITSKQIATLDPKGFTANFESTGCIKIGSKKYDTKIKFIATPKEASAVIDLPNLPVVDVKFDISLQKGLIEVKGYTNLLGLVVKRKLEIKNYNSLKYESYLEDKPSSKFIANAALIPGQIADARAAIHKGSDKKELFHATLKLDDKNFLQPDAGFHSENVKDLLEQLRDILITKIKLLSTKIEDEKKNVSEDIEGVVAKAKESIPDATKTQQFYQTELNKFMDELAKDKTLEDIGVLLKNIISSVASITANTINGASEIIERIFVALNTAFSGIMKTIQADVIPKLREIAGIIYSSIKIITKDILEVAYVLVGKAVDIFETFLPQLKAISATLSEVTEDVGRFILKTYESIRVTVIEQFKHLKDELKASPIINDLKVQYDEFLKNGLPSREAIVNSMRAIGGAIRELVLVPEFQNIVDLIEKYLEKKIMNIPVDDAAELGKIGSLLIQSFGRISTTITKEVLPDLLRQVKTPHLNLDLLKMLPLGGSGVKISALEYLLKESHKPLIRFLINTVTLPREFLFPPPFVAEVLSTEVITFDKKLYHFPGSCSYLLAKDAVDGNFTVSYTLKDSHIESLIIGGKFGILTLQKEKSLLNNVETEYPINEGGIHAYRHLDRIEVITDVGLWVSCQEHVLGCGFVISGFYHGRLRGILGNANNEEFDDLTLPNGKIAPSIKDLAPAYSIGQCNVQPIDIVNPKPSPLCDQAFGWESPLKYCFPFVPNNNFKKTCEMNAASGNEDSKFFPVLYAYKCWELGLPVVSPHFVDVPCQNSISEHKVNDEFDVKLPGKMADVAIVLNTNKETQLTYKEYVQPLVAELVKEFKTKGISDVLFYLIVFGGENKLPSMVTVKGDIGFTNQAPDVKFAEAPKPLKLNSGCTDLDKFVSLISQLKNKIKITLGIGQAEIAYIEGLKYPFRSEAVKTLIAITGEGCEQVVPLPIINLFFRASKEIHLTLILDEPNIQIKDEKNLKDLIGFNHENVITLSEIKTNPAGSDALYKELSHNNQCFHYTNDKGGDVYPANLLNNNRNSKELIVEGMAKNIVGKTLSKQFQLKCKCSYSWKTPFKPHNHCEVVDSKEK